MESVGFKEWALVCEALGRGQQSIILRKGGIAEGREGFSFRHGEFFLFPTWFHEQPEKVRPTAIEMPRPHQDKIDIQFFARVESSHLITSWDTAEAMKTLHVLQPEVVRERFEYDETPGLHVALVRIFRVHPAWRIVNEKKYGGCRSWVNLPKPPAIQLNPVLSDDEHERRRVQLVKILRATTAASGPSPGAPSRSGISRTASDPDSQDTRGLCTASDPDSQDTRGLCPPPGSRPGGAPRGLFANGRTRRGET